MQENIRKEIRTPNEKIKIAEVIFVDNIPQLLVRNKKKLDIISLNDIVSQMYGKPVTCKFNKDNLEFHICRNSERNVY